MRAISLALLNGLGIPPRPFPEIPADWSRRGIGLSDPPHVASVLGAHFDYTNTYYDRFPQLDILSPPPLLVGQNEFVISSDVFEHVPPPVDAALAGLAGCLRPGGCAVVTVPLGGRRTREYYPDLQTFQVTEPEGSGPLVVHWTDGSGESHVDPSPEFHQGGGLVLAFRAWGEDDMLADLEAAGLAPSAGLPQACPELGVPEIDCPGLYLARKPG